MDLLASDVILVLHLERDAGGVRDRSGWRTVLVDVLDHLTEVVLDGSHGGDDGRRAEAVCDEREVREVALDVGLEDRLWARVAQRRPVLVQQVAQLLHRLPVRSYIHRIFVERMKYKKRHYAPRSLNCNQVQTSAFSVSA